MSFLQKLFAGGTDKDRAKKILAKGMQALSNNQFEQATKHFTECLRLDPELWPVHFGLGSCHLALGRYDDAVKELEEAVRCNYEDPQMHNSLARAYLQKEDYGKAIEAFRAVVRFQPDNPDAYFDLGMAYYLHEKWDQAAVAFTILKRLNPGHPNAQQALDEVCAKGARLPEGEPATLHERIESGDAHFARSEWDQAEVEFQAALEIDPDCAWTYARLGGVYANQDRVDQAFETVQEGLRIYPKCADLHAALGLILVKKGDVAGSIREMQIAQKINDERAQNATR